MLGRSSHSAILVPTIVSNFLGEERAIVLLLHERRIQMRLDEYLACTPMLDSISIKT